MSEGDADSNLPSTPPKRVGGVTGKGFLPGQSGNTAGPVPKWAKEAREALKSCLPDAVARLRRVIQDGEDKDANAAAKIVLDFTLPKPTQRHKVSGQLDANPLREVSTEALQAYLKGAKEEKSGG